jgi:dephospho-CoA kinase
MKTVGLTGSIAMGKSATSRMFADEGVRVFDADAVVHSLFAAGGRGVSEVARIVPEAVVGGSVDRRKLADAVKADAQRLARLEAAIHPLVREEEAVFRRGAERSRAPFALFDIPLLFETGRGDDFDAVVVVTAPAHVQMDRIMARPGMTAELAKVLLARQLPDAEKRDRADFVVDTGRGFDFARDQVRAIVNDLRER